MQTSIVLGRNGGTLVPLKRLTQVGLGGTQGSGDQKVSWIHELDFTRAVAFLIAHPQLSGSINLCVPKPTDNKTLMQTLRRTLHIPFRVSHPKWLLNIGAIFIGTETELIIKSRNVIPKRLLDNGFNFKHESIENALRNLINN